MVFEDDGLKFAKYVEEIVPILEKMSDLMKGDRISLQNNKFQMENNHRKIMEQQVEIAANQGLIDEANGKAGSIVSVAEERAKEIEKGLQTRAIQIAEMEKSAKKKLEIADKAVFDSRTKKPVAA